ncbi:MAG: glycoside hydrolase family 3 C-terminal domain-containing protein [Candidatus Dormiibacterota bacterium]
MTSVGPPRASDAAVDLDALVEQLTLDEKASLTAGLSSWYTVPVARLGIPSVKLTDGPNGARGETSGHWSVTPSVCIPAATALGATWDPALVAEAAAVVARQARDKGARVLLAPTVNLHRHPLWGRNFEAFSEDPVLTAKLGVGYIRGVQAQGVAATVKHFVGNETEFERYTSSSVVDERTLRELYLLPFEHAVRVAGVLALMTGYNRLNGKHVPDDARLIAGILRGEWGFEGIVMTDWRGLITTAEAGRAGLDLEMPGPARGFGPHLADAVRAGEVKEALVDAKVHRLLAGFDRVGALSEEPPSAEQPVDRPEDRELTRRAAADAAVLLSNHGVLPLVPGSFRRIAVLGPNAGQPTIMGGGSAAVVPHYQLSTLDILRDRLGAGHEVVHEPGTDAAGIERAVELARGADAVVVVVGSPPEYESEGWDRQSMDLPGLQDVLVTRVLEANRRSVVAVNTGAPVTMPWADQAGALLQVWFAGQELARALVDVLVGDAEPGGRLPTTIPLRVEHTPAFGNFPGESSQVRYGEGLLVGYRWYEARHLPVRYPFGHGLSYTTFEIGPPHLSAVRLGRGERLRLEVTVTNTGERRGAEVVQLYVEPPGGGTLPPGGRLRPVKELKAFAKVRLAPGGAQSVTLELGERAFAYYDVADLDWPRFDGRRPSWGADHGEPPIHRSQAGWYVDGGTYRLHVARSSAEVLHTVAIEVAGGPDPLDPALLPD